MKKQIKKKVFAGLFFASSLLFFSYKKSSYNPSAIAAKGTGALATFTTIFSDGRSNNNNDYFDHGNRGSQTDPFGNFMYGQTSGAPFFRYSFIQDVQSFSKRSIFVSIGIPYRYVVQRDKNTGKFKFQYGDIQHDLSPTFFVVGGNNIGEISYKNEAKSVHITSDGAIDFMAGGVIEKRTKVTMVNGAVEFITSTNVDVAKAEAVARSGVPVREAHTVVNMFGIQGHGQLIQTADNLIRPTYHITWFATSYGDQHQ
jgi:hypothetical protein